MPKERLAKLKHFNLHYPNPEYPVLAFMWAIIAGGEHALYCDFTEDYSLAYLIGRFNDPDFTPYRHKLLTVLARLERDRDDPDKPHEPTHQEWDIICDVLKAELKRGHMPDPVW